MKILFVLIMILIIVAGISYFKKWDAVVHAFKKWKAKRTKAPVVAPTPVYVPEPTPVASAPVLTEAELIASDARWDLTRPVTPAEPVPIPVIVPGAIDTPVPIPAPMTHEELIATDSRWDLRRRIEPAAIPTVLTDEELIEGILRHDRKAP